MRYLIAFALLGACAEPPAPPSRDAGFPSDAEPATFCVADEDCPEGSHCVERALGAIRVCESFQGPQDDAGGLPEVDGGMSPPEDAGGLLADSGGGDAGCWPAAWRFEEFEVQGTCVESPLQHLRSLELSGTRCGSQTLLVRLACPGDVGVPNLQTTMACSTEAWTLRVTSDRIEDGRGCYVLRSEAE